MRASADRLDAPPWTLGEWTVRPSSLELIDAAGRCVRLEARAMRVLMLLKAHAGELVTTEQILDEVWEGKVVGPNSVANVISDLRKALGEGGRSHGIETIPKRGYRLTATATATARTSGAATTEAEAAATAPTATPHRQPADPTRPVASRFTARVAITVAVIAVTLVTVAFLWLPGGALLGLSDTSAVESGQTAQYLRARQLWSRRDHEDTLAARRILLELIRRDADFAPAHAALADIYAHKTGSDLGLAELETFREAQRHLDRARALDPRLPESYVTQALLDFYRDDQPEKALAAVDLAQSHDPNFAYAWQTRAMLLSALGRHEESLAAIARARQNDPASESIAWDEVWFLYLAGDADAAALAFERQAQRTQPHLLYGALIQEARGDSRRALDFWLQRLERRGAQLADPGAIRESVNAGSAREAYAELVRQTHALDDYRESNVVLAAWALLSGDPATARELLTNVRPVRDNWLTFWARQMPVFEPVAVDIAQASAVSVP